MAVTLAIAVATAAAPSHGASSSVTVTFNVRSNTTLDPSGCGGNASSTGVLAFGTVPAGSPARSGDCTIDFGSTNDTSSLRMRQLDSVAGTMYGQPDGTLDAWGTGSDGARVYNLGGSDVAYGASLQPDGKLLVGGRGAGTNTALLRILPDGNYDPDFDGPGVPGNGTFTLDIAPGFTERAYRIQWTPEGIIVPIGADGSASTVVARLDDLGAYDPDWGTGGIGSIVITPGRFADLNAVAIQDDGSVLVGGCVANSDNCVGAGDVFLARFTPQGNMDSSFGGGDGVITMDLGGTDKASMIALQSDGKIVVSGSTGNDGWVGRFNADGTLDTAGFNTLDTPGYELLDHLAGVDILEAVAVKPNGTILAAGQSVDGGQVKVSVFQLRANGTLDTTGFGVGGVFVHQPVGSTESQSEDFHLLPDGSFLLTGRYNGSWATATKMLLMRVNANGTIAAGFGTGGTALVSDQANGFGYDIEEFSDGRIAIVGRGSGDVQIAVFEAGSAVPDYAPGTNDFATAGSGLFGVCIESVVGATTTWTTNATCPLVDGHWRAVPFAGPTSVAASTAGPGLATATFAFGVRTPPGSPTGSYSAPVVFEVIAPA
jgi:uncharacterized delta-60 repeat protein